MFASTIKHQGNGVKNTLYWVLTVDVLYDADAPTHFHLDSHPENERRSSKSIMWFGIVWIVIAVVAAVLGTRMV